MNIDMTVVGRAREEGRQEGVEMVPEYSSRIENIKADNAHNASLDYVQVTEVSAHLINQT